MHTRYGAWVLAALVTACGHSTTPDGPQFIAEATESPCPSADSDGTLCFTVTARNLGPGAGDGKCWVAAIRDFETELVRSEPMSLLDVGEGEEVTATVQLEAPRDGGGVQYPANCDPGPEG